VTAIVQDRRGFIWFATRDGLNRYDGNAFVVYKNNPNDPGSLSSNFIQDLKEDDHGYLWIATNTGVSRFDPTTERCTRYLHDPNNPNTIGGASVKSIAVDSRGYLWFGTEDGGLDKLDLTTGTFAHYRNDSDGRFVGRITQVIEDSHRDIWFVGERGLFHLNQQTGQITRPPATRNGISAASVYEDEVGNLWMLTDSPIVGLVKYDRQAERLTRYPLGARAAGVLASTTIGGSANGALAADGKNGLWVPSSLGLYYFDWRTERYTHRFHHDESNPDSLDSNTVLSIYRDRSDLLWVGTENAGLNTLNFRQEQFVHYRHRPADPTSVSPGRVKAIYQDPNGVLWVGFFSRTLDRLDRNRGQIIHYFPNPGDDENSLGEGTTVDSIYKDAAGYLWVSGGGSGVVRFDERAKAFVNYTPDPGDPHRLNGAGINTIHEDRTGTLWIGTFDGLYRLNRQSGAFARYTESQGLPSSTIRCILEDGVGRLWLSTQKGVSRFDPRRRTFRNYDVSDGLQSNEFSTGCYQGADGEMFFGGSNGFNAFFPDRVRDNPFVPPVVLTSFKIYNKPVAIGAESVLKKAIPYAESLTLFLQPQCLLLRIRGAELRQLAQEPLSIQARGLRP
jgi:ligand-binding sensor domain-containing protein